MILYFSIIVITTMTAYMIIEKSRKYILCSGVFTGKRRIDLCNIFGFGLVFVILAFFSAVRYGAGGDYFAYVFHIDLIQRGQPDYMEAGFKAFVLILSRICTDPRFIIAVIGVMTVWFYVRAIWDQSENIPDSIFIFLAWGYYFLTYMSIRNYFALALVLYAAKYIGQDRKRKFILFVLIAAAFHKTALICIPLYLLADRKMGKLQYILTGTLIPLCLLMKNVIRRFVFLIYPSYENSAYDTGRISYFNIMKAAAVIGVCLICYSYINGNRMYRMYFHLNVFAVVLYTGIYWIPEISRIGFYMNATAIFLLPAALKKIRDIKQKRLIKICFYLCSFVVFYLMCMEFNQPASRILPYHTWLFQS